MQKTAVIFSIAERTIQLSNTSESFYVNCFFSANWFRNLQMDNTRWNGGRQ